jgi:hypothetical protein
MARRSRSNYPDRALLDELTDAQRNAVLDGAEAIKTLGDFKRRSYDLWMTVARGVAPLCELADRPGTSRSARKNLLEDNGYGSLNDGTVSRLLLMAKHETEVRKWRDGIGQHKRDAWNSPTSICNRCPALRKAIAEANKNKPPRRPRQTDKSAALESLLDKLLDLIGAVEDSDNRRALVERVTSSVAKLLPEPTPSRKKRGKAKAPVEVKREVAPGHTKTAEQALAEHRAKHTTVVVPGLGAVLEIPTPGKAKQPRKRKGEEVLTNIGGLDVVLKD